MVVEWLEGRASLPTVMRSNPSADILFFVENSRRRFVGKIRWTQKATGKYPQIDRKIPADTPDKNTGIFTSICRGTASHNVYLTEKSPKLKKVWCGAACSPHMTG